MTTNYGLTDPGFESVHPMNTSLNNLMSCRVTGERHRSPAHKNRTCDFHRIRITPFEGPDFSGPGHSPRSRNLTNGLAHKEERKILPRSLEFQEILPDSEIVSPLRIERMGRAFDQSIPIGK